MFYDPTDNITYIDEDIVAIELRKCSKSQKEVKFFNSTFEAFSRTR